MLGKKRVWTLPLVLLGLLQPSIGDYTLTQQCESSRDGTIYDYQAKTLNGSRPVSLSEYRGKTVLIVNVATFWGLTFQYLELNALHEELKPYGLNILGFPCNQMGKQEPGEGLEIFNLLKHGRPGNGFVPNFLLFERGDVNGENEQGLYTFLKNSCPPVGDSFGSPSGRLFWDPFKVNDVKWNFEKFLVGPDGKPVMRWHPYLQVSVVRADIIRYFQKLYGLKQGIN